MATPAQHVLALAELPVDSKKTVTLGEQKILLVRTADAATGNPTLFAVEAECPHAKAPLEKGAVCNGRLVCPWHAGTFALETGTVLEPPPLRDLKRFAVSLQGDNILVSPDPLPAPKPTPVGEGKHIVLAGGGAASAAALATLRDSGFAGKVTLIEPNAEEPIDRTQLTKNALAGQKPLDSLPLFRSGQGKSGDSLAPLQVERRQATVIALEQGERSVHTNTGEVVPYDALLLATGSRPRWPQIEGIHLPHVFTIRNADDLRRVEPQLTPGARVAILGDSFIALEGASALRQRGLHVTVIAQSKLPFAQKFGEAIAEAVVSLHRSQGVHFHTETSATAVTPVSVVLNTGAEVPADLVLVAVGVEPITSYAPDLPAGRKGGFAVGPDLRLTPSIWCAGDIASVNGTRIEHWRLAEQHGRTAALGMLAYFTDGATEPFAGVPLFWTFHFGKRLNYIGHADTWDQIVIDGDPATLNFVAFYLKDETLAAVLECGRDTAMAALMEPLRQPLTLSEAQAIVKAAA